MHRPLKYTLGNVKQVLSSSFVLDHMDRCGENSDLKINYTEGDKSSGVEGSFESFVRLYKDAIYYTTLDKSDDFKPSATLKASAKRVIAALDKAFPFRGEGYSEKV